MTTNTFTGAIDTDWNVDGNWSAGHKPTVGEDAVIPNLKTAAVTAADANCLSLVVQSGAHFSYANAINLTSVGNMTFAAGAFLGTSGAGTFIVGGNFDCSLALFHPTADLHLQVTGTNLWHNCTISKVNAGGYVTADASDNCTDGGGNTNVDFVATPTVTSVFPAGGPTFGGTPVTITGTGFAAVPSDVTFGGVSATNIVRVSSTQITCWTPAHAAGAVDVVVSNDLTHTGTGTNAYTYAVAAAGNKSRFLSMGMGLRLS